MKDGGVRIDSVQGVAALGPDWDAVFAAGPGVQSRRAWFEATETAALPPGTRAEYLAAYDGGRAAALLPLRLGPGRAACSLTTPYSVLFQPLLAPGTDPDAAGRALGRVLRRRGAAVLEALDPEWPGLAPFCRGLGRAGPRVERFEHFGNWHLEVSGLDWAGYLAGRPGTLRETIRRKGRAAARDPTVRIDLVRDAAGLQAALAAYEDVYARSWKVPEPFPRFNAALLGRLAPAGAMRLAVLWQGGTAMAAQYWTVEHGVATVLKLAHDKSAGALSPGTVLTAHVIRTLFEEGGLRCLDFGRGDDPYKQPWTGVRRQRIGLLVADPLRPAGLAALGRHWLGAMRRRAQAVTRGAVTGAR